ncbi:MAG: imidazole glycerol phosphate synthase subunit HisH [Bacteroidales bacterium]|nr:imidazole glycerol phosphate synthase subunit HisH [Bacteroidales bacterium]MBR2606455.1 imidazole glycerol phosphate synthase subunit HisH [Bacteroidaceae bacterium]
MIAIVDYDTGNLCSVWNALERIGAKYVITDNAEVIKNADKVLLPGVGEASSAMKKLHERGLCEVIKNLTQPVLGICIGMQLMCRSSEEGNTECLGIFDTEVKRFYADKKAGVKVPHMGWNEIHNIKTPLLDSIKEGEFLYFVHSFAPQMCDEAIATSENGMHFAAALNKGNFYGTQFHPEKSGSIGELILKNFIEKC